MWWKFLKKNSPSLTEKLADQDSRIEGKTPQSEASRRVGQVELVTRKKATALLSGAYKSLFRGQGMQFSDFRVYSYGDDIRHIDWRITARTQETYIKLFDEEREMHLIFAVDVSQSTRFGTTGVAKREIIANALACLGFTAIDNQDRVGLLLFSDKVEKFVPPKKGKKNILRIIDEILTFEATSPKTNPAPALKLLANHLKSHSVIVWASDFFGEMDQKTVNSIAKKHDLIFLHATDPRDAQMPAIGLLQAQDLETGSVVLLDTNSKDFQRGFQEAQKATTRKIRELANNAGASYLEISTNSNPMQELNRFFQSRKRKR